MKKIENLCQQLRLLSIMGIKPNFSELARLYGMDRRTVKKIYENGGAVKRKKKEEFSRWDPYLETIEKKMALKGITIRGLYEFFCETIDEDKIPGSYESLKAFIRKKEITKNTGSGRAHPHFETEPGKQIQVDWIEDLTLTLKNGKKEKFNIFSATLGYSKEHTFLYSPGKTTDDFIRCVIETFTRLGGLTNELLTDNMSAVVNVRGSNKSVIPKVSQLFKDLGVTLKLCKVRSPQTKGKCESANRFRSWLTAYENELESAEDIRKLIDEVLPRRVNNRINGTTLMPPAELFKKEMEYLNPLPSSRLLDTYLKDNVVRTVPSTLLVPYQGCGYSVSKEYIGRKVHLYRIENELFIYCHDALVAIHSISNQKKNYHPDHYAGALESNGYSQKDIKQAARKNLELLSRSFKEDRKEHQNE